jgi:two-component system chemotaxis response regulator CheB
LLSRIRVITHPRARLDGRSATPRDVDAVTGAPAGAPFSLTPAGEARRYRIVALGASTGGPGALLRVFQHLPPDFPLPIVVVLHLGEPFGARFAEWFDAQTALPVNFVTDRMQLTPGIWLAPPDRHVVVQGSALRLTSAAERHSCRPSVDVLFESVAASFGDAVIAALLTGMGRDGASGLRDIQRAGGLTIAQDEATCVVYGMPREAVLLGAADRVMPLEAIGPFIQALARQPSPGSPL